ncbi:expressed unknown protein [Seminavis robusta]|uniref:Uncharacterized protein n=1 Tax=Seminavis robusta TaxID=568900 RepID=A0A9N8DHG4_9STRA|nr:expressed unknown protein [Seminavis robusta]|eukprot:Sro68_g038060.1 n/a (174) ;mRNA; f:51550-52071
MQPQPMQFNSLQASMMLNSLVAAGSFPPLQTLPRAAAPAPSFTSAFGSAMTTAPRVVLAPQQQQQPRRTSLPTNSAKDALKRSKSSHKNLRFLVLIKILLQDLEQSGDYAMRYRVKQVVQECNRRRKSGDLASTSLERLVESALKTTVGDVRWGKAKLRLDAMMCQRRQRHLR